MLKKKNKAYPWIMQYCDYVYRKEIDSDNGRYKILIFQHPPTKDYWLVKVKNGKVVETHDLTASPKEQIFRNVFVNGEETTYFMITRVHRGDSSYLKILIEVNNQGISKYDVVPLM